MDSNYNNGMNVKNNDNGNKGLLSLIMGIISILFSCGVVGIIPGIVAIVSGAKISRAIQRRRLDWSSALLALSCL